jgi:hypothetical protein
MDISIVGEDSATKESLKRIVTDYNSDLNIVNEYPARGGKTKQLIKRYNLLAASIPILLLTDLDQYDCAPEFIRQHLGGAAKHNNFLLRVAVDEVESWLMADRVGFAEYFEVPIELIPQSIAPRISKPTVNELSFPFKPSLYMQIEIFPHSTNKQFREGFISSVEAYKGPEYNSLITPFIQKKWNLKAAAKNSYSLRKAIERISSL